MIDPLAIYVDAEKRAAKEKYAEHTGKEVDISADDDKSIIPAVFALQHCQPRYRDPKYATYLRYVPDDGRVDGFLQFSGKNLLSSYSKLESEVSEDNPKLVHIRCSYNNKYWVRRSSKSNYIVATATDKEYDQSKWSCTLFEPIYDPSEKAYRFRHVQLGYELYRAYRKDEFPDGLVAKEKVPSVYDWENYTLTTVIDWDLLFMFSKHVTFKGSNGKYLRFNGKYLQFSGTDLQHPSLIHEIFHETDGALRIKNLESKRFWFRDPNWILATAEGGNRDDRNLLFQPVKLGNKVVALRNLGNNNFCKRLTADSKDHCLNACASNPDIETRMEVSEAVVSRRIENIEYRVQDARIYGVRVWSMAKGYAINRTKAADTVQFTFSFEDKRKKSWTNTLATKFGVATKFDAGVPMIGDGKISVSVETGGKHAWGETHKDKFYMSCSSTVTVPPMSKVKLNAVVKRGCVDVPFWYTQTDTLIDGQQLSNEYDDGLFTGVNSYDFEFKTDKEVLPVTV